MDITTEYISDTELCLWETPTTISFKGFAKRVVEEFLFSSLFFIELLAKRWKNFFRRSLSTHPCVVSRLLSLLMKCFFLIMKFYFHIKVCIAEVTPEVINLQIYQCLKLDAKGFSY